MHDISWLGLGLCFVPIVLVAIIYWCWFGDVAELLSASARMFAQLIGVGYLLVVIFENPSPWLSLLILTVMFAAAAWISIRPVKHHPNILKPATIALSVSVLVHLAFSIFAILQADTWYDPRLLIPLAGMYFSNTMTCVSLTAERYYAELNHGRSAVDSQKIAFQTAMIPRINSLLAVGIVSLPGMMTGQILAGASPLVAVRYQIMIMTMILGTSAVGSFLFLYQLKKQTANHETTPN